MRPTTQPVHAGSWLFCLFFFWFFLNSQTIKARLGNQQLGFEAQDLLFQWWSPKKCLPRQFRRQVTYMYNRARRQSGFPTFISCQRQDAHVLPKRRQSHQGDKLYDVSTVPLVARGPVFLARGSDADGEPHSMHILSAITSLPWPYRSLLFRYVAASQSDLSLLYHTCCLLST